MKRQPLFVSSEPPDLEMLQLSHKQEVGPVHARSHEDGFTLVELMVVILIIGIIVSVAIPTFNIVRDTAAEKTCMTNQRTIEGAVQQWLAADIASVWTAQVIDGVTDDLSAAASPYIKEAPRCPVDDGLYGVNDTGTVTADDLAPGDPVPGAWTSGTGHAHF